MQKLDTEGYVYLVRAENGLVKIGLTKDVRNRMMALQPSSPTPLEVIHVIQAMNCHRLERHLHKWHRKKRVRGEWFALDDEDIAAIRDRYPARRTIYIAPPSEDVTALPNRTLPKSSKEAKDPEAQSLLLVLHGDLGTWESVGNRLQVNKALAWKVAQGKTRSPVIRKALGLPEYEDDRRPNLAALSDDEWQTFKALPGKTDAERLSGLLKLL